MKDSKPNNKSVQVKPASNNIKSETASKEVVKPVDNTKKRVTNIIFNTLVILLLIYAGINVVFGAIDFFRIKDEKDPIFSKEVKTVEYENGTVNIYQRLSYKIFEYKMEKRYELHAGFWFQKNRDLDKEAVEK